MLENLIAKSPEVANSFCVNVLLVWRDYADRSRTFAREKIFWGKDKASVYEYIKYYCLAFGMVDVQHRGEGWGCIDNEPDMTDPEVQKQIKYEELPNEESKEPTTQKTVSRRANKKKSRKKR